MTAGAQPRVLIRVWYHDAPSWRSQLLLSKPRVVFVLGLVSLINSLTSGKNGLLGLWVCGNPHVRYPYTLCLGRLGGQASTLVVS